MRIFHKINDIGFIANLLKLFIVLINVLFTISKKFKYVTILSYIHQLLMKKKCKVYQKAQNCLNLLKNF